MVAVEEMLITLGGFGGSGFTFLDLTSNVIGVGGLLASLGAFAAMKGYILSLGTAMKSMFLSTTVLNTKDRSCRTVWLGSTSVMTTRMTRPSLPL